MMNNEPVKHIKRRGRGQSGQSIIVLAIGFVALLGFVGIVTDVSLLFVRYSALSRAVDAAAVSAAGQMRRIPNDLGTTDPTDNVNGEAASITQLQLAARQFIDAYGINTSTVVVETCRVQRLRDTNGNPVDRTGAPLYGVGANPEDVKRFEALCTDDELKLVRVTAQILAPTTFLNLLGYGTVTLSVEAISQTAVLDVALIFDVSESMLNDTNFEDWEAGGYGYRYLPRTINWVSGMPYFTDQEYLADPSGRPECWNWSQFMNMTQEQIQAGFTVQARQRDPSNNYAVYIDPATDNVVMESFFCAPALFTADEWLPTGLVPADHQDLQGHAMCQSRVWPRSSYNVFGLSNDLYTTEYVGADPVQPFATQAEYNAYFNGSNAGFAVGFVPTYNFYGCCNDPNGDFDFGDLVCEPFKTARDSAASFLERLDFLRGDRVAYVTFDRSAFVIDPDGVGAQIPMIETQTDITGRRGAEAVLAENIGVRAEPNFYGDIDTNGVWDCLKLRPDARSAGNPNADNGCYTYDEIEGDSALDPVGTPPLTLESIRYHPVSGACPLDSISMDAQYGTSIRYYYNTATTLLETRSTSLIDGQTPLDDITTNAGRGGTMPAWAVAEASTVTGGRPRNLSYEYVASCAGTNIGGALANASNMLYLNGRREGAVWLMVMLSDGAAGASDPFRRTAAENTTAVLPDAFRASGSPRSFPGPDSGLYVTGTYTVIEPVAGQYGAFGLCPYGTQLVPGELTDDRTFPQCSDVDPDTRTFCGDLFQAGAPNLEPLESAGCETFYDVDDYARDWADWVAVADLTIDPAAAAALGRVQDQLLPSIYTIGFGLDYSQPANTGATFNCNDAALYVVGSTAQYNCLRGINPASESRRADYLGEELLRYIADAGDNFRIDNDHWQEFMGDRISNGVDLTDPPQDQAWGPRGACEVQLEDLGGTPREDYAPLAPQTSCGNYFSAGTTEELTRVFNEIASRLFTRLSQ